MGCNYQLVTQQYQLHYTSMKTDRFLFVTVGHSMNELKFASELWYTLTTIPATYVCLGLSKVKRLQLTELQNYENSIKVFTMIKQFSHRLWIRVLSSENLALLRPLKFQKSKLILSSSSLLQEFLDMTCAKLEKVLCRSG